MSKTQRNTVIVGLALVAVLVFIFWLPKRTHEPVANADGEATAAAPTKSPQAAPPVAPETWDNLRAQLQQKYGNTLRDPSVQMRVIAELLRFLESQDEPFDPELAAAMLEELFPGQADALIIKMKAFVAYRDWMVGESNLMLAMGPDERKQLIWEKRRELFGDEAEVLWQAEIRNEQLSARLADVDRSDAPVTAKAETYIATIREVYGDGSEQILENHRQEVADRFVSMPSVQAELSALTPDDRRKVLYDARKTLGMSEDALTRWVDLDAVRDERWNAGQTYMAARRALPDNVTGAEREQAVKALRDQHLGAEAETIGDEEAAGYFRFNEPRVYGIN